MASLLGNLVFAGLATLAAQTTVGGINTAAVLSSFATGIVTGSIDSVQMQPSWLGGQSGLAQGAGVGFGAATLGPLLFTRAGGTVVAYNPNSTVITVDMDAKFNHSIVR